MSGDGSDVRVIDRAELERFAAQRRLPEAVLAQLRSRAKNELSTAADGTFKMPALKKVAQPIEKSTSASSAIPRESPTLARSQSAATVGNNHGNGERSSIPVPIPRLSITEETLGSSPTNALPVPPSPNSMGKPRAKPVVPLELSAINSVHRMPFNLESHTQQGADEYHAEENQDRHCYGFDHSRRLAWMGISDGHCGSGAADFIAENIVRLVSSCLPKGPPTSVEELIRGITKGVYKTEEAFKKIQDGSGACLLLCCLWEETLVVANVGDSRAILGSVKGGSVQGTLLTNDHNASNELEAKLARYRFLRNQGLLKTVSDPEQVSTEELIRVTREVMEGDDIIVNGRLFSSECTRTIGDCGLKKACFNVITCEPEFTVCRLTDADSQLILGCDGVWRTIDAQRAVEIVAAAREGESPAQRLVKAAVTEGSGDDQTCLVLDLVNYRSCLSSTTDLSSKIFKGLSIFDNNTAQALASSAHRTFSAKLARLHKSGSLGAGQSVSGMFEQHAKKMQAVASSVHRESRGKFDRAAAPAPYAGLSLFEQKPKAAPAAAPVPRRLAQSSMSVATDGAVPVSLPLSRSTEDSTEPRHLRTSSAGSASAMQIDNSATPSSLPSPGVVIPPSSAPVSIHATAPPLVSSSSAPTLMRSRSSPQMEPETAEEASAPAKLVQLSMRQCLLEDIQQLLSDLHVSRLTLPPAQYHTLVSNGDTIGLLSVSSVSYGFVIDNYTSRVSLLLLPAHKPQAQLIYSAVAFNLLTAQSPLQRLECCVDLSECKVMEDAGWKREGLFRSVFPTETGRKDGALYTKIRGDSF